MQTIYVLYTEYDNRPVEYRAFVSKEALINHFDIEYHSTPVEAMSGLNYDIGGWGKRGNPDDQMLYIEEFILE